MSKMQAFVTFASEVKKADPEATSTPLTSTLPPPLTPTFGVAIDLQGR